MNWEAIRAIGEIVAYGPQSSLENPRVPLQPVPDMAQGVEWAFEIPIRQVR